MSSRSLVLLAAAAGVAGYAPAALMGQRAHAAAIRSSASRMIVGDDKLRSFLLAEAGVAEKFVDKVRSAPVPRGRERAERVPSSFAFVAC
jgi:hypothetical protein